MTTGREHGKPDQASNQQKNAGETDLTGCWRFDGKGGIGG
jgi:hypothetical protein